MPDMKTKYEILVDAVAYALEDHSYSTEWYFDFDEQTTVPLCRDADCQPEDGHRIVRIEPMPSWQSFQIMEDFADSVSDFKAKGKLFSALSRRHPFSSFQDALCYTGLCEEWFAFKNERMKYWVERWMEDNEVTYTDDCAGCDNASVWISEEEDDEL